MMVSSSRNDEAILAERQKMEEVHEQNGSRIAQSSRLNCVDQALKKSSNVQTVKALGSNVEVKPSSGDVIATSKRQKTEEGHEKNGCSTRQAPRSFAGVFDGGDEDDDEGPIVFKRSSLPSKSKAVIDTTATKKDVLLISVVNEVLKSDKPESQPRVSVKKVASTTSTSAPNSISNSSCFTTRDPHFKQPKSTSTLPPNPLSGKKISISSTVSANSSICQNVNDSVSPDFSGRKTHQTPCDYKASVSASRFAPDKLLHTSSNQQKDVVHRKASGASLGTSISQSSNCSTMEQEMHSSHSSKISNLAATKDSEIVTSVAFIKKSSSKFEKDNSDSIENKPLVTKLASSTEQMVAVRQSATRPESSFKTTSQSEEDSGSEDDKPLCERLVSRNVVSKNVSDKSGKPSKLGSSKEVSDGSDDDKPLAQRLKPNASKKALGIGTAQTGKHLGDKKPLSQERLTHFSMKSEDKDKLSELSSKKRSLDQNTSSICSSAAKKLKVFEERAMLQVKHKPEAFSDDEDEVPLAKRSMSSNSTSKPVTMKKVSSGMAMATKKVLEARKAKMGNKKKASSTKSSISMPKGAPVSGGAQKWTTLEHNGVIFPPPYRPHGIKILYDGKPVNLTPAQEEVATMFAVMKDTDYATKQKFISNFWSDWKQILGSNNVVKKLELCDFTPIYEWHIAEKEKKKSMSAEEKKRIKAEKLKLEETYMWALVDGVKEKVGNFRVEPPGLFRGRGEHPKMGKLKKRIFPENIVINVGEDAPIPECPMPGHRWKEIRHDNTVTWLAYWNDPINSKEFKYVFLAPSSSLKGQSDKEKYEKSRKLKDYIEDIRKTYTKGFSSSDSTRKQIAVATYLIDRLALRAGNEKDDDEADTVGCCSLKVEHVSLIPPRSLEFDFLGKDSIRYFNTVEVDDRVYKAIGDFKISKAEGDDLFDKLDTSKLNAHLKEIMPGLTAKVFRTYNASITLDTQLQDTNGNTLIEKIAAYQGANKEVAILCNHQRSVSKSHSAQMERLELKMVELQALRTELKRDLDRAKKGKPPLKDADGKIKRNQIPDALQKKLDQTNQKIKKMELDMRVKDDLKTVALGTSKINYMDPRITVAWCKLHEVPIEKIFNKSLLAKFSWAMDVEPDFRF